MPKRHKPRSGSMQYWPRKRAKRVRPAIGSYPEVKEARPLAFAGWKAGMTSIVATDENKNSPTYGQKIVEAATVVECPPLLVVGARAYSAGKALADVYVKIPKRLKIPVRKGKDLMWLEKNRERIDKIRLLVCTQPGNTGIGEKRPDVFEIGLGGSLEDQLGYIKSMLEKGLKELKINDIFREGQFVDVIAVTKGKGFGGVVKRYGVRIRGRKDEKHHRQIGVIGTKGVARVLYSIPQPGQLGYHRRTEFNKQILRISDENINPAGGFVGYGIVKNTWCLLLGSVPGPKKRPILLRYAIRPTKIRQLKIQKIENRSQQGI